MLAEGRVYCQSVRETLRLWHRTVWTLQHQLDDAEMSWIRSVLGMKCLDTIGTATSTFYPQYLQIISAVLLCILRLRRSAHTNQHIRILPEPGQLLVRVPVKSVTHHIGDKSIW